MQQPRTVGIIGGGIAGLTSAYYLARRAALGKVPPVRILLFERSSRFGGWIDSKQLGSKYDSHIYERGPRTLRLQSGIASQSPHTAINTIKLLEELNLFDSQFCPIEKTSPANKNKLIYFRKNLINVNDLSLIFGGKPLPYPPVVYALYEYFSKKGRCTVQDETIKSFMHRRFGKPQQITHADTPRSLLGSVLADDIVEYLLDPLLKGVYAGSVSKLSARTVLKKLFVLEQRHGSIIAGLLATRKSKSTEDPAHFLFNDLNLNDHAALFNQYAIYYLKDGMEMLVKTLVENLRSNPNVELVLNQSPTKLDFTVDRDKPIELTTRSNERFQLDHLISAVPAFDLAALLDKQRHPVLRSRLNQIAFVNMIVINLLYEKEAIFPMQAFGYLIPSRENSHLLGVLFDSCIRHQTDAKKRGSHLTVMLGGVWFDELRLGECTDEQLMHIVRNELKKQMNLDDKPLHYSISRMTNAIPVRVCRAGCRFRRGYAVLELQHRPRGRARRYQRRHSSRTSTADSRGKFLSRCGRERCNLRRPSGNGVSQASSARDFFPDRAIKPPNVIGSFCYSFSNPTLTAAGVVSDRMHASLIVSLIFVGLARSLPCPNSTTTWCESRDIARACGVSR